MKHYRQRSGINECGHVAVAALTEIEPLYVMLRVGHAHCTKTWELKAVLNSFGWATEDHCIPWRLYKAKSIPLPEFALVQVHNLAWSGWHWVALGNGKIYDGQLWREKSLESYIQRLAANGSRITSFLPVWKKIPLIEQSKEASTKQDLIDDSQEGNG